MTPADIKALAAPISESEPCGPDLEMIGDADYMRFVARIEGVLPKVFGKFDRSKAELPKEIATVKPLLERSRDLRLFAFLAKLLILDRDLAGYLATIEAIGEILETHWEPLYPQLLEGDPILRVVCLQTLDDMPDSVMPLQSAPLFETRRFGKASYRSHLLASGVIQGREAESDEDKDEEVPSGDALRTALAEADIDQLVASRGQVLALRDGLARIEEAIRAKTGQPNALSFDKIKPLAQEIVLFLDGAVAQRDPALALEPGQGGAGEQDADGAQGAASSSGPVRSFDDARAALAAATRYFMRSEPSSPVLLLIGQAEALMGKSFYEAMQALVPELAPQATLKLGRDTAFRLPLERLSSLTPTAGDEIEEDVVEELGDQPSETWDEPAAAFPSEEESAEQPSSDEASGEDATGDGASTDQSTDEAPSEEAPAQEEFSESEAADDAASDSNNGGHRSGSAQAHKPTVYRALNRQDAVALLGQIAAYFRVVEPSSPVPVVLEHASVLAGRDFIGLLRDVLPASALRVDE